MNNLNNTAKYIFCINWYRPIVRSRLLADRQSGSALSAHLKLLLSSTCSDTWLDGEHQCHGFNLGLRRCLWCRLIGTRLWRPDQWRRHLILYCSTVNASTSQLLGHSSWFHLTNTCTSTPHFNHQNTICAQ